MSLQWGHGGEAVEDYERARPKWPDPKGLQWGHGGEAVEDPERARMSGVRPADRFNGATAVRPWKDVNALNVVPVAQTGFNGATAVRPWKNVSLPEHLEKSQITLQWGHGGEAVERQPIEPWRLRQAQEASMGPRR